ncbi:MAG: ribosome assembly cofactor RimP [Candidatus Cryptobacteroides sp.]
MNATIIIDAITEPIVARGLYIIDVSVSKDNDVEIVIDSEKGTVELEDCVEISRFFESRFDREKEDYSITVTSAGLDQPFRILRQFEKAVGSEVEVALKGGRKFVALLTAADESGIELKYTLRETVEGSKKKQLVEHNDRFSMEEVNWVRPFVRFE